MAKQDDDPKLTRMGRALADLVAVDDEIEQLRRDIYEQQAEFQAVERAINQGDHSAELAARSAVLAASITRLGKMLPDDRVSDHNPPLKGKRDAAKEHVEALRRERHRVEAEIETTEKLKQDIDADLDALTAAVDRVVEICTRTRRWPFGMDERTGWFWRSWVKRMRDEIEALPLLRRQLAELAEDD